MRMRACVLAGFGAGVRGGLGLGAVLCGLLVGCAATTSSTQATPEKKPELQCDRTGAERVDEASWRGQGRSDVARVYVKGTGAQDASRGTVLSCREVDLNGDGRKDTLVYYDPAGRKLREEFDQDYDGRADLKAYYEEGRLARQELDVNSDGKVDLVQHFEQGRMVRVDKASAAAALTATGTPAGAGDGKPATGATEEPKAGSGTPATAPPPSAPPSAPPATSSGAAEPAGTR